MSRRMRVLMPVYNEIDYDGRVQRAAEAVGARHDVTVLSIDSGHGYRNPHFHSETVRVPEMTRLRGFMHLIYLARLCRLAVRLRPDVIHAHDFHMAVPGWIAARLCGARLVYDAHELYIPEPEREMTRNARFWYRLEKWTLPRVDQVIAANEPRARIMREHFGLAEAPLAVQNIQPAPEPLLNEEELFRLYPALAVRRPGALRVVYQGDIHMERGLGFFVDALPRLGERFDFVVVGGGVHLELLRARVRDEGLEERVTFLGRVPRNHLFDILRQCDIGVISYRQDGLNNLYCAPNKLYDYPQAGLPMVGLPNPVLDDVFARYGVGVTSPDAAEALERVAAELPAFRARLGAFLRDHTWDVEAAKLARVYAVLAEGEPLPRRAIEPPGAGQ